MKKRTQLDIINELSMIHNNIYDYSTLIYNGMNTKVDIICKIHGVFQQTPSAHKKGQGCPKCGTIKRNATIFDIYGVSNVSQNQTIKDKKAQTNLDKHGHINPAHSIESKQKIKQTNLERYGTEFPTQSQQIKDKTIQTSLKKYGIPHHINLPIIKQKLQDLCTSLDVHNISQHQEIKNKKINSSLNKFGTTHPWQSTKIRDKIKHTILTKYGCEYIGQSKLIKEQVKNTNITRYGCHPRQTKEVKDKQKQTNLERYGVDNPTKSIMIKSKIKETNLKKYGVESYSQQHMTNILHLIHDYNWLFEQYITQNKSAIQISKELNISDTTIGRYLAYHEIQIKNQYTYSYYCICWLESIMDQEKIYIQHAMNEGEYKIPGTRYTADGYCRATNTIYEFHGDYWHGNPEIYEADVMNESTNCTMGELYQKTLLKEQKIKELGYNLVVMWENTYIK